MKKERCNAKLKRRIRWLRLTIVILCTLIIFSIGYLIYLMKNQLDDPELIANTIVISYSEQLPVNPSYYFVNGDDSYELIMDDVDIVGIGEYQVNLTYMNTIYEITFDIIDDVAPEIYFDMYLLEDSEQLDELYTYVTIEDYSEYSFDWDYTLLTKSYETNGMDYYQFDITAIDEYDNVSTQSYEVIVTNGYTVSLGNDVTNLSGAIMEMYGTYIENGSEIAFAYYDLSTNELIAYNAEQWMTGASTYKLALNMLYQDLINEGTYTYEDTVTYCDSGCYEASNGSVDALYSVGDEIEIQYLMEQSLLYSSNTAARILYHGLGGLTEFKELCSKYSDVDYASSGEVNITTVNFLLDVVNYLVEKQEDYQFIIDTLSITESDSYGSAYTQLPMIHKYGAYSTALNEVGWIMLPQGFTYVILTDGLPEDALGQIVSMMIDYHLAKQA